MHDRTPPHRTYLKIQNYNIHITNIIIIFIKKYLWYCSTVLPLNINKYISTNYTTMRARTPERRTSIKTTNTPKQAPKQPIHQNPKTSNLIPSTKTTNTPKPQNNQNTFYTISRHVRFVGTNYK